MPDTPSPASTPPGSPGSTPRPSAESLEKAREIVVDSCPYTPHDPHDCLELRIALALDQARAQAVEECAQFVEDEYGDMYIAKGIREALAQKEKP